jgi:branched-chain amino acid aminotransferase
MLELRERALVDLAASSVRHGLGLFESVLVRDGRALRLGWHLERLAAGTRFLRLDEPPAEDAVDRFAEDRLGMRGLAAGVLRLYAADGFLALVLSPGPLPPLASQAAGIATSIRRWSGSPLCRFKTLSYLENIILAREAEGRGLGDVIALNEAGNLSDGGRTSLFVVMGGRILTPPCADGALPGIARRLLLESGLAREERLPAADLTAIEGAFLTNALRLVIPLDRLEGRDLDPGHPLIEKAVRLFEE